MLDKIISFSIRNKLIVGLFVLALIVWGIFETTRLPIDAVPDITDNQVQVITVSPSLGAPDVERLISYPIEQACSSVPGIKQVRSFSRFGLSLVTIVFDESTDVYWARQQISERLQMVARDLPAGIGSPELAPVSTGLGEIYQYVVRPLKGFENKYDVTELRTIQDWIVRRHLLGTPGVAEVSSFGGKLKQYEIAVMPDKLKAHGISIGDIFGALEQNNENTGGAYIEKGPTVLYIRSEGLTRSLEDIRKIVVKTMEDGTPLLMSDVAEVKFGAAIRYGAMTYNDKGEVAGAVVMMLKGANASTVTKAVKEKIAVIQKMLPDGVVIEPFLDRTKMVDNAISTVETNLIEGALIVIFVLVFMLGNLRAGLIVSSVIPLAMLFAIILMNKFGVGGNLMSLGAIDFGLIVDGSVIVIEAILHRFMHSKHFRSVLKVSQDQMDTEVATSTGQMIKSAIFSQVIILIVYLPILSLQGIEGKMFKPMAYTIAFAILGAFILSVTYVPMMAALFLSKKPDHKPKLADKMLMKFSRVYQPMLTKVMHYPVALITATLSLFVVSVVILMNMGGEFMPQLEEGDFAVETRLLTGSNLNTTIKLTQQAAHILLTRFPEVQKVVTKIGSAEIPTDPMPMEAGDMMVILKDKKQWTSATSFDELSRKMTKELEEVPGLSVGFQFPVQMRFNELMTGARQDIVCKIFGEDLDSLTRYAHTLNEIIGTLQGAKDIYEEKVTGMLQVVIRYNRDAMAKYGMNVAAINRTINTAFAGQVAGQVYEGERRFDMVVRLAGDARDNVSDIQNLLVSTNSGVQIPLSAVATIDVTEGVNQIQREQTRRRIIVGFNVGGRDVKSIVDELQQKVNKQLKMPKTYSIVYGGSFENMTAATERLSIVVPIALFLIFLLLYFAFNSVKQGLLIYSAIPLSAIGGILALWLRDMPFSISAGVGFIALFGVAVLNGILLVTEFNRLKAEGWTDVKRIVIHATKSKLRAVLMTALVPSLGFIPMAISTGAGGEVQKPLATVVIGGLIVSTLLTLFVLPILYILFEKGFKYFRMSKPVLATILLVGLAYLPVRANEKITLKAAIDSALHSNNSLRVARGEVAYFSALRNAGFDVDKTGIQYQYGKFNSLANDNSIAVTQAIKFPTVYKHQRNINQLNILLSESSEANRKIETRAAVKHVFYSMLVMQEKVSLLRAADSLYGSFLAKSRLRFDVGDIDVLELTTLENQQLQIAAQLLEILGDYEVLKHRLRYLTNTLELYEPKVDDIVYSAFVVPDNFMPDQTPSLIYQAQKAEVSLVERRLETSKLLPSLIAGFNSMTIMGWQPTGVGTERYFGSGDRFASVTVGIGVPVFYGAQRSRIRAANRLYEVRTMELDAAKAQLMSELDQTTIRYRQQRQTLQVFRQKMLPNADKIISTANQQLNAGAVGYINWTILINQSFQIRNEYLNTVQKMNDAAFEIEKIISTN